MKINEMIKFGPFSWRVLHRQEDRILLLTEFIIEKQPYHNSYKGVTWATCSLREYLNNDFLNNFSPLERSQILLTEVGNQDNPWYNTSGGISTRDYVFLLSIEEVVSLYFGDSTDKLSNRTPSQKYWFGNNDVNNEKRIATFKEGNESYWWWLRSPGRQEKAASYIHGDGNVGINGNSVFFKRFGPERDGGVRPAIWVKI